MLSCLSYRLLLGKEEKQLVDRKQDAACSKTHVFLNVKHFCTCMLLKATHLGNQRDFSPIHVTHGENTIPTYIPVLRMKSSPCLTAPLTYVENEEISMSDSILKPLLAEHRPQDVCVALFIHVGVELHEPHVEGWGFILLGLSVVPLHVILVKMHIVVHYLGA